LGADVRGQISGHATTHRQLGSTEILEKNAVVVVVGSGGGGGGFLHGL